MLNLKGLTKLENAFDEFLSENKDTPGVSEMMEKYINDDATKLYIKNMTHMQKIDQAIICHVFGAVLMITTLDAFNNRCNRHSSN